MIMEFLRNDDKRKLIIEPIFTHTTADANLSAALGEFLAAHPGMPSFSNVVEKLQSQGYGSVTEFRDEVLMITGAWQDFFEQDTHHGKMLANTIAVLAEEAFRKIYRKMLEPDEYKRENAVKAQKKFKDLITHPMQKDFRLRMDEYAPPENKAPHNIDSKIDPGPWPQ